MNDLIQWPRAKYWDHAWNPVIGCQPCSPACEHCYARKWAERFGHAFMPHETKSAQPPRSGVVFCGNLTDLWGEWNFVRAGGTFHKSCDYIAETLGHDKRNPYRDKAAYLWLTKRVSTMAEWVADGGWETDRTFDDADCMDFKWCDMSNQFFGFTAEDQDWYNRRTREWRAWTGRCGWINGWLSAEPLLGPIDLGLRYIAPEDQPFEWVVVGCESGANRRPCKVEWVEGIVSECLRAEVPVFVKQLDLGGKCVTDISKFPEHLRIRQVPWTVPTERPRQDKE